MEIIDRRQGVKMDLIDVPYGAVFLDNTDKPKMKVAVNGHDYLVELKTGNIYRVIVYTTVTLVDAVLTIY